MFSTFEYIAEVIDSNKLVDIEPQYQRQLGAFTDIDWILNDYRKMQRRAQ